MRVWAGIAVISIVVSANALAQDSSGAGSPRSCREAKEGLPTEDPLFKLTGKITMKSGTVYDVVQFGKAGIYSNYAMTLRGPQHCGIQFFQISRIERDDYANRWRMTLLNGYSPSNTGGMFYVNEGSYHALVGSPADPEKLSWVNVVAKEPRFAQPREISLDPRDILAIEIFNPLASPSPAKPAEAPKPASAPANTAFVLPTEFLPYPPPTVRDGIWLLFRAETDGALTLTNLFDVAENINRGRARVVPGKQELIWISGDGRRAAPYWYEVVTFKKDGKGYEGDGRFQCMKSLGKWQDPFGGRSQAGRELNAYNPCASLLTLTDNSASSSAANAVATIATFGLAAIDGGHQEKRLDRDKLKATLERNAQEIEARLARAEARRQREQAGDVNRGE